MRATRGPDPRPVAKTCLLRVLEYVTDLLLQFVSIAHNSVVRLFLPESPLPAGAEHFAYPSARETLPGKKNFREIPTGQRAHHRMHMIRHDAPGQQFVALAFEMPYGIRNYSCHLWVSQRAGAMPLIQPLLCTAVVEILQPSEFIFTQRPPRRVGSAHDLGTLDVPLSQYSLRQAVSESEGYGVHRTFLPPMRQISSLAFHKGRAVVRRCRRGAVHRANVPRAARVCKTQLAALAGARIALKGDATVAIHASRALARCCASSGGTFGPCGQGSARRPGDRPRAASSGPGGLRPAG